MAKCIDQVKTFIEDNLKMIQGAEYVADRLGMNYETLRKKFRNYEGITLAKYITFRRVERAKLLLMNWPDIVDGANSLKAKSGFKISRVKS